MENIPVRILSPRGGLYYTFEDGYFHVERTESMGRVYEISSVSAAYRMVGVITLGVTRLPIVGFGYPESMKIETAFSRELVPLLKGETIGEIEITPLDKQSDRITWRTYTAGSPDQISGFQNAFFSLFLDLPVESRAEFAHARLFAETAQEENGFLVAVTLEQTTRLFFYGLKQTGYCPGTPWICKLTGLLEKYTSGTAVPLLRTIERLKSQIAPQRRIEIPDHELGIIYEAVLGEET